MEFVNLPLLAVSGLVFVSVLIAVAERLAVPMAQVALAWLLTRTGVSAPIIGTTRLEQLDIALGAPTLDLCAADLQLLTDAYTPNRALGMLN